MMEILRRPYLPLHAVVVYGSDVVSAEAGYWDVVRDHGECGLAETAFVDGELLMIYGVYPIWEGRGFAWAHFARTILERPKRWRQLAMMHATRRVGVPFIESMHARGFTRIEAAVDESFDAGHHWARLLGFRSEGLMRCYQDGADHRMYARIADDCSGRAVGGRECLSRHLVA